MAITEEQERIYRARKRGIANSSLKSGKPEEAELEVPERIKRLREQIREVP